MKNLRPWSHGDMTELERALLEAARADRIPSQLELQMVQALSAQPPAAATGGAAAASGAGVKLGALLFSKSGLWGTLLVAALAVGAGLYASRVPARGAAASHDELGVKPSEPVPAAAVHSRGPASSLQLGEEPLALGRVAPQPHAVVPQAPARVEPETPQRVAPLASARPARALQQELELLDRARSALRAGESHDALALLEQHARRFTQPALRPEAEALRIEALVSSGANARAAQLSQRFLHAHPAHPLAHRVAELTAR